MSALSNRNAATTTDTAAKMRIIVAMMLVSLNPLV
jgi:hypothetical protein